MGRARNGFTRKWSQLQHAVDRHLQVPWSSVPQGVASIGLRRGFQSFQNPLNRSGAKAV
jgi:hypothetical protein